ncbi:MAG: DUF1013 domain-containing protein [Holosporaceae bacterium]|jgi:hypothetical protein|nr:DUF1013 domain-containing protein [Holosporaceae bacterium]
MAHPIMPQGIAVWLVENTALTFEQIAKFCGLHPLEVQALADEQVSVGMIGVDPIKLGQLTQEEIDRCSVDSTAELALAAPKFFLARKRKGSEKKYTPLLKRRDRPDAIAWLLKFYPDIPDAKICSLLSTTKPTVTAIRNRTYAKINDIHPRDPVLLGFCSQTELDAVVTSLHAKKSETAEPTSVGEGCVQ